MASEYPRRQPALAGIPLKHFALAAVRLHNARLRLDVFANTVQLIAQNVGLALLIRYSRIMPLVNGERYYASTAVLLSELAKLAFFLSMALYEIATRPQTPENSTLSELASSLSKAVFAGDSWKLAIPASLFVLQNNLQYTAAGNMDAATFSITYQLKIVSTAVFGMLLLGKALNLRKWLSLSLTVLGVGLVQLSHMSTVGKVLSIHDLRDGSSFHSPRSIWDMKAAGNEAAGQLNKRSATYEGIIEDVAAANPRMNATIGFAAVVCACIVSGFACTFFERVLKAKGETRVSVWVRNVQLSFYSIWPALFLGVLFVDGEHIAKTGFLTGYNWVVYSLVILQAAGGILTAVTISYSDSLTKTSATTISSVVTFLISALFLELHTSSLYLLGVVATYAAALLFNTSADDKKLRPPPINVTQHHEKSEPGYFDLEAVATAGKSPLRDPMREALSTSRPGTPVSERRPLKSKSNEMRYSKRDQ